MSIKFVPRDSLEKASAIIVLTGNGWERTDFSVRLFKDGWAPILVMVGSTGSRPPKEMAERARERGVPVENVMLATTSGNTHQNAVETLDLAKKMSWQKIILVTSPQHQLRAWLSFRKINNRLEKPVEIINCPPTNWSWFDKIESSRDKNHKTFRFFYLFGEIYRIIKYFLKGDL